MAVVGISMVYLSLLDPNTHKLLTDTTNGLSTSGILPIDKTFLGTQKADIKGLAGKFTDICGNNQIMDSYEEPASTSVSLTINNLDPATTNKLLGLAKGSGMAYYEQAQKPLVGLVVAAPAYNGQETVYYAFPNGRLSKPNQNLDTNTSTKKNVEFDIFDFEALGFDGYNGNKYGIYLSTDSSFTVDAMFKDMYPEYTGSGTVAPSTSTAMPAEKA